MLHRIETAVQSSPPDIEKRACNRFDYRLLMVEIEKKTG